MAELKIPELRIDGNTLIADGEQYQLNPYGYGNWVILVCVGKGLYRRYATDADLSQLLVNPKYSVVPVPFEVFPQYTSKGSILVYRAGEGLTAYLIAPKYTGHTPLPYTRGGKGVPR